MNQVNLKATVPDALARCFQQIPKAAIAFSGGVDSAYLLYAAKACGVVLRAYYVNAQFQPAFELADARRLGSELAVPLTVLPVDILKNERVRANPADRCYHCKSAILETILSHAAADGYETVMEGSNASDDAGDRPGMRALAELSVRSPLRMAGLTKKDVRHYAKEAGLFVWDKPSYACLATRIPTDTPITAEILEKIETAETALADLGFTDFRARLWGDRVKLQFTADQMPLAAQRHEEIAALLTPLFSDILLDLKPRSST